MTALSGVTPVLGQPFRTRTASWWYSGMTVNNSRLTMQTQWPAKSVKGRVKLDLNTDKGFVTASSRLFGLISVQK